MKPKIKPYDEYRATGEYWCGEVPAHWDYLPIRRVGQVSNGGTPTSDDTYWNGKVPFLTPPDLRSSEGKVVLSTERTLTQEGVTAGSTRVPAGSVIVSIRAPIGYVGRTAVESALNQGCRAITPKAGHEPRFLAYSLIAARGELEAQGRGTTFMEISATQFLAISVPLPPPNEQLAIADFLDARTSEIDELIAKQSRLLETLYERRSAIISTTLTKGLNGERLRSTGNPFSPLLPESWNLTRFGREITVNEGLINPSAPPWSSMTLIAPNHIERMSGRIIRHETAAEQSAQSGKYLVRRGQVLYSKIRPSLNKVGIAPEDCLCSADIYAISSKTGSDHDFLAYWMRSAPFHRFATSMSSRVKMPKLNREELSIAPWARPSVKEQKQIVRYLDEKTAAIDALARSVEKHIALAGERRAALITAAVTGQIDVRTSDNAARMVA